MGLTRVLLTFAGILAATILSFSQDLKGKDGNANYATGTFAPNRYSALASTATAGSLSITVSDISQLAGTYNYTNSTNPYQTSPLSKGDLVLIIQMQGANISTSNDHTYGAVTSYNGTGQYEFRTVYAVSGNTILLCENLTYTYQQSGRARSQVVRIPRLQQLQVATDAVITGLPWNGTVGGIVALETQNAVSIQGKISATALGFRGGTDDKAASSNSGDAVNDIYVTTATNTAGGKGESIAGNQADYLSALNGANGRGAPANGGGGGNGHNSGGGGGSNAGPSGYMLSWNGTGIKDRSGTNWSDAWNLEKVAFAIDSSSGGGRGGYTYSSSNQDALLLGPGQAAWGGNKRQSVGGFGGRPLDYAGNSRLFMGGGGGAGDGNNSASGNGGNGGGIVFLLAAGNITGSGTIEANGQNGFNTQSGNIDAAGGGGGGGAIVVLSQSGITGISLQANGGNGGNQLTLSNEAEGPGGGGGGGYIASSHTGIALTVAGGQNGHSYSAQITEFTPNGATMGAPGTTAVQTYFSPRSCDESGFVLPVTLMSFTASFQNHFTQLTWLSREEVSFSHYELEKSSNGREFQSIFLAFGENEAGKTSRYSFRDVNASAPVLYYRLKMVDQDGKIRYSEVRSIRRNSATEGSLSLFPNPATDRVQIQVDPTWQNKSVLFEVFDLSGKTLFTIRQPQASASEWIGTSQLTPGIYIIRASYQNNAVQERLVKR